MAKSKKNFAKILDFWSPPQGAGEAIGCIATSYTFDSQFFEEECMGRFMQIDSTPENDGPIYLIERETKLQGLSCKAVMVDKDNCKGDRSISWDLIPFRGNLLHAKITMLVWSSHVRLIIGSANLTPSGYRLNQEIFSVVDYYKDSGTNLLVLKKITKYLKELADYSRNNIENPEIKRWNKFIDESLERSKEWGIETIYRGGKDIRIYPITLLPGKENIFQKAQKVWQECIYSPPRKAIITSPFFNSPDQENATAKEVWNILNLRGFAEVNYNIIGELESNDSSTIVLHGPDSLSYTPSGRSNIKLEFYKLDEKVEDENGKFENRPLHQKSIWLENDDWALFMIGSSNFTSAGYGMHKRANHEANIAYAVNKKQNGKGYKELVNSLVKGTKVTSDFRWLNESHSEEETKNDYKPLPLFFNSATYILKGEIPTLCLRFNKKETNVRFAIFDSNDRELYNHFKWNKAKKSDQVYVEIKKGHIDSSLKVVFGENNDIAWWSVIAESYEDLPGPIELAELPLEMLITILSTNRPLHHVMRRWLRNQNNSLSIQRPVTDPHKNVDTRGFLLKRTRRISYAIEALRIKLEQPVYTEEALNYRLTGPIGIIPFCDAILNEAHSDEEKAFLIAEIALELAVLSPCEKENSLPPEKVRTAIEKLVTKLLKKVHELNSKDININIYVKDALKRIKHVI